MNILITGFPGSGKTTIAAELVRRGYAALDPEEVPGYMHTVSRVDGRPIAKPSPAPAGWYDTVGAYIWDATKMRQLLSSSRDSIVCSKAHNQADFYSMFDLIFVLRLDSDTLAARLKARPGKHIGKTDAELYDIMRLHNQFEQSVLDHDAVEVDTSHTLSETVEFILHHLQQYESTPSSATRTLP